MRVEYDGQETHQVQEGGACSGNRRSHRRGNCRSCEQGGYAVIKILRSHLMGADGVVRTPTPDRLTTPSAPLKERGYFCVGRPPLLAGGDVLTAKVEALPYPRI